MYLSSCKQEKQRQSDINEQKSLPISEVSELEENVKETQVIIPDYDTLKWTEITEGDEVLLALKYATKDNFTKQVIYPCARCFLRPELASKLLQVQRELKDSLGYKLLLFDCYRPRPAQQRLWDIYPDLNYVTPPTKGSMHNRGLAVDLTIIGKDGIALDMGTDFDFFGPESHSAYGNLPSEVLDNRMLLKTTMNKYGLTGIRTEWWHFSLKSVSYKLSDWEWECDN